MFAWLDVPDDHVIVGAVVVCPSIGLEAAYSVRTLRDLSHRLARARRAALRFDYVATGDSAGDWSDPGLVAEWLGNVRTALDVVRALGAARVGLVGLRLGATLAAAALSGVEPVDDLVWWDACGSGRAFLREQVALTSIRRQMAAGWGIPEEGDGGEAVAPRKDGAIATPGVVFSAATADDLKALSIAGSDPILAARELVLVRRGRKLERRLAERVTVPQVEVSEIIGQEELFGELPVMPGPTLDRIVSWLSEPDGPLVEVVVPVSDPVAVHREPGRPAVLERPLALGPAHLFGMLTEPEEEIDPSAPTVVFLNVGLNAHHGPGRLWVELARACAAGGTVRCLRVDLSGIGDSPARPGRSELRGVSRDALHDIADIRRDAASGGARLILMGVCSGADYAIGSALADPVASICVINPALYGMQWGNKRDKRDKDPASEDLVVESADGVVAEFGDRHMWGATGPLLTRAMALLAPYRSLTRWIPAPGWWVVKRWLMTSPVATLEHLVQSGVDLLVVVGGGEARRVYRGEQRRLHALIAGGGVHMETVSGLDHGLLERTSQERVAELFIAYVNRRTADLAGSPRAPEAEWAGDAAPRSRRGTA